MSTLFAIEEETVKNTSLQWMYLYKQLRFITPGSPSLDARFQFSRDDLSIKDNGKCAHTSYTITDVRAITNEIIHFQLQASLLHAFAQGCLCRIFLPAHKTTGKYESTFGPFNDKIATLILDNDSDTTEGR